MAGNRRGGQECDGRALELVATDLDGTLLRSDGQISDRARAALAAARRAGLPVVTVTGRPAAQARQLTAGSGMYPLAVCGNGAEICDLANGLVLRRDYVPLGAAIEMMGQLRARLPEVSCTWENHRGQGPGRESEAVPRWPVAKLLIRCPGLPAEVLATQARAVADGLTVTWSTGKTVEVLAPGVSKGAALARLARWLGVSLADVLAIGDAQNDLSMLGVARWAVAVRNASPALLASADLIVASNDEEGVAQLLERLAADRQPPAFQSQVGRCPRAGQLSPALQAQRAGPTDQT
jgi:hydroxymethylpyrimidine pyrophosphatase-like HAD family hydrolase